jgi:hypothetical protein
MIDYKEEIGIFLERYVKGQLQASTHTLEQTKVTKNFENLLLLYGEYFKKIGAMP